MYAFDSQPWILHFLNEEKGEVGCIFAWLLLRIDFTFLFQLRFIDIFVVGVELIIGQIEITAL